MQKTEYSVPLERLAGSMPCQGFAGGLTSFLKTTGPKLRAAL